MTNLTRRNALRLTAGIAALPLTAALAKADGYATAHTVVIKGMKFKPANIRSKWVTASHGSTKTAWATLQPS